MNLNEIRYIDAKWICLAQDRAQGRALTERGNEPCRSMKGGEFLGRLND
jgi:hypothetical protein